MIVLEIFQASTLEHYMKNITYHPIPLIFHHSIIFFSRADVARVMIFKGKRSRRVQNFSMDVNPGYEYIENFRGGVQWYMMDSKDFISSIGFKL